MATTSQSTSAGLVRRINLAHALAELEGKPFLTTENLARRENLRRALRELAR